ncbi:MAG TPA: nucleoside triphosphate pyrophosphatase [Steroidobacteraceae bacterium]|nr:nucleoside triphosphate pyrophosphatase [Steroidobacteraceae bacterium]
MSARPPRLVLASTSPYRRALLERLGLRFEVLNPAVEEAPLAGESPERLALRLACAKAEGVALADRETLVIGSDQVAALGGTVLGKPGTVAGARAQLAAASGRSVVFYTAVALARPGRSLASHTDRTDVRFRTLSAAEIERYVARDQPLDCAASFRSEGLGIALLESIETGDPTALVGLPLIWLAAALKDAGLDPLLA